jgi:hypothetical protein
MAVISLLTLPMLPRFCLSSSNCKSLSRLFVGSIFSSSRGFENGKECGEEVDIDPGS